MNFSIDFAIQKFPEVLKGAPLTILIAVVAMLVGFVLSNGIALARIYKVPVLSQFVTVIISFVRGTPMVVQIYLWLYGLPLLVKNINVWFGTDFSDEISPLFMAFCAFSVYTCGYQSETMRSALLGVDKGQLEAAQSIGMTTRQGLIRIMMPQAMVQALPNLGNIFVNLIKGTSLAFSLHVVEIMASAKIVAGSTYRYLEMYVDAAIIYWIICIIAERLLHKYEHHLRKFEKKMTA